MAFDPGRYLRDGERDAAVASITQYFSTYTGRKFDDFARRSDPNRFTAWDMVALNTLSVDVPADAAIRLIEDDIEGSTGRLTELLATIPVHATIWDPDTDYLASGDARELWGLIKSLKGLRRTKTSKLLAAKRPFLFPIYDKYVGEALLDDQKHDDWPLWREFFLAHGEAVQSQCSSIVKDAGITQEGLSPLRVLDIVIWMAESSS